MGALQVLIFVTSAVLVLENGSLWVECAPSASYSYTTVHRSSSSSDNNNAIAPAASQQHNVAGTYNQDQLETTDYRKYLPVENTPEVKKAREQFFRLYEKQARLASGAPDVNLDGTYTQNYVAVGTGTDDHYDYYDYYSHEDDDEDDSMEDDEDDEDSDEDDYSDEDSSSSSSSSEEDDYGYDSSSEEGESSSEESSEEYGDDSSSSSSSSSEEDGDGTAHSVYSWHTNSVVPLQPVTDTPEVKLAKRKFFDLYKTQAQLAFDAPDDY